MPPVVAAIIAVGQFVAGVVTAIGAWTIGSFAIGEAILTLAASVALNLLFGKLFAPKVPVAQRQAQNLEVALGETPREALFGLQCTGGTLANIWNDGGTNEYETAVYILADHKTPTGALKQFIIGDAVYDFTASGAQNHAALQDGGPALWIEFHNGAPGQALSDIIEEHGVAAGQWEAGEAKFTGLTYVVARYKISEKVWKSGRPATQFKWVLEGLECYDARFDDTIDGGDGDQRWDDPTTRVFSDNARVCHANFVWGVWNYACDPPQLMVGPGKSFEEAPIAPVIVDANICDENVSLKAGGAEKRYRCAAIVRADTPWIDTEDDFAAAMGGEVAEIDGGLGISIGAAKVPAFTFTDDDLLRGQEITYQGKITRDELINSISVRYVDRAQLWEAVSAPVRRSLTDIAADGEVREQTVELAFVTSPTQAQRIGEIHRRRARCQRHVIAPLGPRYMLADLADWAGYTSDRYLGGATVAFQVHGASHSDDMVSRFALREISSSVYAWNPAIDELDPLNPAYLPPGALEDAELSEHVAAPIDNQPAILVAWAPPTDASIRNVLIEWRQVGSSVLLGSVTTANVASGQYTITSGLTGGGEFEVRITPMTVPQRDALSSGWMNVSLPDYSGILAFTPVKSAEMAIFGRSFRKIAAPVLPFDWGDGEEITWGDDDPIDGDAIGWSGFVRSTESYAGGAQAIGIAVNTDKRLRFGLAQSPATSDYPSDIDFGWDLGDDGFARVYELDVLVWDNDGDPEAYAAADVFQITYDNAFVRYYIGGVLKYERAADPGLTLGFDSSFYGDLARLDGVTFTGSAASGNVQETRYTISAGPPATPTGSEPEGWSVAFPPGSGTKWSSTATRTLSGMLLTEWSTPARVTSPNPRGIYSATTPYYFDDLVQLNGGTYRLIVETVTGVAPSGTAQSTPQWEVFSAPGGAGEPASPPSGFGPITIDIPPSGVGVNLFDLAVANGYSGIGAANITFEVESGVVITGLAGAPNGGHGIRTGVWAPGYSYTRTLRVKSGGAVRGGGGEGGDGGASTPGYPGGAGGAAIWLDGAFEQITFDTGSEVKGGGGGGGGGNAKALSGFGGLVGGGGGGGGQPNGPKGEGGEPLSGGFAGNDGTAGTTAAAGTRGTSASGHDGTNGGAYGAAGASNSNAGAAGAAGPCIAKNGYAATVTNNSTNTAGTIG